MKIYISSFNNANLLKKMEKLRDTFLYNGEKETTMIYSEEGIYEIDASNIFKICVFNDCVERSKFFLDEETHEFLVDKTEIHKIKTISIPFCHQALKNITYTFSLKNTIGKKDDQIMLNIVSVVHEVTNTSDSYFYFEISPASKQSKDQILTRIIEILGNIKSILGLAV